MVLEITTKNVLIGLGIGIGCCAIYKLFTMDEYDEFENLSYDEQLAIIYKEIDNNNNIDELIKNKKLTIEEEEEIKEYLNFLVKKRKHIENKINILNNLNTSKEQL